MQGKSLYFGKNFPLARLAYPEPIRLCSEPAPFDKLRASPGPIRLHPIEKTGLFRI